MTYNPGVAASSTGGSAYIVSRNSREEKKGPLTKEGTFYKQAYEKCEYEQLFDEDVDFDDCLRREVRVCEKEYSPIMDSFLGIGGIVVVFVVIVFIVVKLLDWISD